MANNTPHYTQVVLSNGRRTYVPVYLPTRRTNPNYVAVSARTLGANTHFRGGQRV